MSISINKVADYICMYIQTYRTEYIKFIEGGYPDINLSPYLYSNELYCYLANDGAVIADHSNQPNYNWEIAGGPTLMVDYPESRTPISIIELLKKEGIYGKDIGIYRLVSKDGFSDEIWRGKLPQPINLITKRYDNTNVIVYEIDTSWIHLIELLTFGALCKIIDIKLPDVSDNFWNPHIIRNLGFTPADRNNKRFFNYLELIRHVEEAAWDSRSINTRVSHDLRRDFAHSIVKNGNHGGTLSFSYEEQIQPFFDRLSDLEKTIALFERLLNEEGNANEEVFHKFIKDNPVLLDVYGQAISKPRLIYPDGQSPLGKKYVEPDFIIKYPLNQYRLIELEKPSKNLATKSGQPRNEVTQAVFQISEWKAYIRNHYELIKDQYPSINFYCLSSVIISRTTEESFGNGRDKRRYKELLKEHYSGIDEILTYDDLLIKAKDAYHKLNNLINK